MVTDMTWHAYVILHLYLTFAFSPILDFRISVSHFNIFLSFLGSHRSFFKQLWKSVINHHHISLPECKIFDKISSCTHMIPMLILITHTHTHSLRELTYCKSSARAIHATSQAASFYIQRQSELISAEECDFHSLVNTKVTPKLAHPHNHLSCLWTLHLWDSLISP